MGVPSGVISGSEFPLEPARQSAEYVPAFTSSSGHDSFHWNARRRRGFLRPSPSVRCHTGAVSSRTIAKRALAFGDRVRIEMFDRDGRSIFGAIDQRVVPMH